MLWVVLKTCLGLLCLTNIIKWPWMIPEMILGWSFCRQRLPPTVVPTIYYPLKNSQTIKDVNSPEFSLLLLSQPFLGCHLYFITTFFTLAILHRAALFFVTAWLFLSRYQSFCKLTWVVFLCSREKNLEEDIEESIISLEIQQ